VFDHQCSVRFTSVQVDVTYFQGGFQDDFIPFMLLSLCFPRLWFTGERDTKQYLSFGYFQAVSLCAGKVHQRYDNIAARSNTAPD